MFKFVLPAVVVAMIATTSVAKPALRDVPAIDDALLAFGLADEIRKQCPKVSARFIKALRFVSGLRDKARDMGYTDAEIDAYRKSPKEKARIRAKGEAYLAANNVTVGNIESYCALGRAEIKKSSQIGALLRVN